MTAPGLGDDTGSAVVDFVLTSTLLLFVFLAVFQLGLALHVRNTLVSCAAEGARHGAREGSSSEQGAQRARDLINTSLSERYSDGVSTGVETTDSGVEVLVVDVTAPVPVVGLFGPGEGLEVRGRAFVEDQ